MACRNEERLKVTSFFLFFIIPSLDNLNNDRYGIKVIPMELKFHLQLESVSGPSESHFLKSTFQTKIKKIKINLKIYFCYFVKDKICKFCKPNLIHALLRIK